MHLLVSLILHVPLLKVEGMSVSYEMVAKNTAATAENKIKRLQQPHMADCELSVTECQHEQQNLNIYKS